MTDYRCRLVCPTTCAWKTIDAATPAAAANDYFYEHDDAGLRALIPIEPADGVARYEQVRLGVVEVDGHGKFTCRVFHSGLWRRGGVSRESLEQKLREIALRLDWKRRPEELIEPGWDLEEDYKL